MIDTITITIDLPRDSVARQTQPRNSVLSTVLRGLAHKIQQDELEFWEINEEGNSRIMGEEAAQWEITHEEQPFEAHDERTGTISRA